MRDEQKLITRCQNGDIQAFRELVERYEDRIYALACSIVGDPEAAKDVAQEAFIRAYKALNRFEGKSSFYTWLYRIATNVCLNAAQKEQRRIDSVSLDGLQEKHDISAERFFATEAPENDIERIDLRQQIDKVLEHLSPDHRAVVVLKDIEDLSQEEIADTLGVSVGTIKSRLSRARAHLRDLLLPLYTEWTGKDTI
ncbi:MAG: sigma-70 family RNA polymerase sigma factor [Candidatus Latescibacteria bacterium]|jgi:RNA polymerase sigma-70 factor, ECF subfamily|nr:sigma-70 family RNA polymerase sigma factor [Candidatus Latescibacterota bacterium]MBT4139014.1 sigma-70 family RNA polymerase sigma factor [Candidatus Latescibacterota bacterium]MBT5831065.1 sigma-70 family RNA polymerase sigma factor [Candidatus Latescibacterota bacterium]